MDYRSDGSIYGRFIKLQVPNIGYFMQLQGSLRVRLRMNNIYHKLKEKIDSVGEIKGTYSICINKKVRYVGQSKNIRKRLFSHFHKGCLMRQIGEDSCTPIITVFVHQEDRDKERSEQEKLLIRKTNPSWNIQRYNGKEKLND